MLRPSRRALALAVAAVMLVVSASSTGAQDQPQPEPILVGDASLAPAGRYPAVAFVNTDVGDCTGTLVAPTWVLTAAHCLDGASYATVVLGSVDVFRDQARRRLPVGMEVHQAAGWISHGEFFTINRGGDETAHHDVALIKLPEASAIAPIRIATKASLVQAPPGGPLPATVVGFGNSDCNLLGCAFPDGRLREGPTSVYADADVSAFTDEPVSGKEYAYNVFMIPDLTTEAGTCFGDSGGPVLVEQRGQPRVAGVISFAVNPEAPCIDPRPVEAAADVVTSDLADWVTQVTDPPQRSCQSETPTIEGTTYRDVIVGSDQVDVLHGGGRADVIRGLKGGDTICGGGGPDTIIGGRGRDSISGNAGDDTLRGGDGRDTITGNAGADTIAGGDGADTLFGNGGRDTISGDRGPDTISGGKRGDILLGRAGNDLLKGNRGNDELRGGPGNDTCRGGPGQNTKTSCEN